MRSLRKFLCAGMLLSTFLTGCFPRRANEANRNSPPVVISTMSPPSIGSDPNATSSTVEANTKESDVRLTAEIRREIVGQSTLSPAADNINIDTQDGRVKLSGVVKNQREKDMVEAIAERIAGEAAVSSQITISTSD